MKLFYSFEIRIDNRRLISTFAIRNRRITMAKKNILYYIVGTSLIIGCNQSVEEKEIKTEVPIEQNLDVDWLLGKWKYEDEDGLLFEDWTKKNDTVYTGESYFVEKDDTVFFEHLRLTRKGDSLFYESLGENKINPKIKAFRGVYTSEYKLEIENLQQAFPRKIKYNTLNDTLMIIEISGVIDGSEEIQPYQMVRINQSKKD
jgi:hypothetical protein